jgi:hypothetical protein
LAAASARGSLARGDCSEAVRHLATLHSRRGGWLLGAVTRMATIAPSATLAAYRMRERLRGAV